MIQLRRTIRKSVGEAQSALQWRDVFGSDRSRDSPVDAETALKISAFYRAVDIRSDSIGKFPVCVKDLATKRQLQDHYLNHMLKERPNEAMSPFVYRKLVEYKRLVLGNSYVWIFRDRDGRAVEEIPLPHGTCWPVVDAGTGKLWYIAQNPKTGEQHRMSPEDILHYKGFSTNGLEGVSLLAYAGKVLTTATARETYEAAVYSNGGHPAGLLKTNADLSNKPDLILPDGTKIGYKDRVRREWEKVHSGPGNAFRVAVLDSGLEYQALSMSNSDAQFVESKNVTVEDIARFTGVPLNLLFTGKQSYNSNEANSLDYVKNTLQPAVTQYEQEDSYKLLTVSERQAGLWLPRNMLAELRGDTASRIAWYKGMREVGAYSVNDIREKEDEPPVPGGDTRQASLNFVPLEHFEQLSLARNAPQAAAAEKPAK